MGKKLGRRRFFKTPLSMQKAIDKYFEENTKVTVTGLCLALKLKSRMALINYEGYSEEFYDIIKTAKMRVAEYYEKNLTSASCTGSIFYLKCNSGWQDRQALDITSENTNITIVSYKRKKDKKDKDNE